MERSIQAFLGVETLGGKFLLYLTVARFCGSISLEDFWNGATRFLGRKVIFMSATQGDVHCHSNPLRVDLAMRIILTQLFILSVLQKKSHPSDVALSQTAIVWNGLASQDFYSWFYRIAAKKTNVPPSFVWHEDVAVQAPSAVFTSYPASPSPSCEELL